MLRRLAAIAALSLAALPAQAQSGGASFDYYLLSLSVAPSFCAGSAGNAGKPECRRLSADAFQATPLTLHGLWPNRARVSVNRQPQSCDGPPFDVSPSVQDGLRRYMPGGPGLARYEWRKHGTCSGLSPDQYFTAALDVTRQVNDAIGSALVQGGGVVRLGDLVRAATARDPALAPAIVVDCRFARAGGPLLEEVRVTLDRSFRPIPARSVGLGQNSGCPHGEGRVPMP